jgi:uncharacterized OsmC-like protein
LDPAFTPFLVRTSRIPPERHRITMSITTTTRLNDVDLDAVTALAQAVAADETAGATTWRADVTWQGAFRSSARIRGFAELPSDEPSALGGTDTAPNPVEQLLAALGHCLTVGYAANASAQGIELTEVRVQVRGDLDLHAFLGLRPGHAGFTGITATVHLAADAPAEQLEELHRAVVATSPVGHTLQVAIPTTITLASA